MKKCAAVLLILILAVLTASCGAPDNIESVTWAEDIDLDNNGAATYYFEFRSENGNNVFTAYIGSIEINGTYSNEESDDGNTLTVSVNAGNFVASEPVAYEITGSSGKGDLELKYTYANDIDESHTKETSHTLKQAQRESFDLEKPQDFVPDDELLGTWTFRYNGYDVYEVTFNDDGTMKLTLIQDCITYNGTYTVEDDHINLSYYMTEKIETQMDYSVSGDKLEFLGAEFERKES